MTNEQQRSPIFCLDKVKKHLYNTIWGIKPLLMNEYLNRCKKGKWTKQGNDDVLKCWNLERIINAKEMGVETPVEMTLGNLMGENEEED